MILCRWCCSVPTTPILFLNIGCHGIQYLGILDLQRAAAWIDVCSVERCLGPLGTLHRVKCNDRVKDKTGKYQLIFKTVMIMQTTTHCSVVPSSSVSPHRGRTCSHIYYWGFNYANLQFSNVCSVLNRWHWSCLRGSFTQLSEVRSVCWIDMAHSYEKSSAHCV